MFIVDKQPAIGEVVTDGNDYTLTRVFDQWVYGVPKGTITDDDVDEIRENAKANGGYVQPGFFRGHKVAMLSDDVFYGRKAQ